jgi:protease-4
MENKEWKLLEKVVMASTLEQKRSRRWGIFFKSLTFIYLFLILVIAVKSPLLGKGGSFKEGVGHTAVIDIQGVIAENEQASADNIAGSLRNAFEDKNTKGIILRINSPGGSPVQSGYVYDEIKRLRSIYPNVKLYAVISDLGASGAYYIAAAADQIYADRASLVGSIGVISSSFGFVDLMDKLGVERRLYTSGENKAFLDPFSKQKKSESEFWKKVLSVTHQQFIKRVKEGRGDRLKDDPSLFSGLIWSGEQALELGLIDNLGSTGFVAREIIGAENTINFTLKKDPIEQFIDKLGMSVGSSLAQSLGLTNPGPLR